LTSTPPIDLWKEIIKLFQHYITTSAIFCIEVKEESGEPEGQKIRAMQRSSKRLQVSARNAESNKVNRSSNNEASVEKFVTNACLKCRHQYISQHGTSEQMIIM